jgi:6-pyruvoyltetrahydropterin/6-carboxytetrahydropterin synthase
MIVTKEIEIDMGHRVPNHKSKCRNPHGHRYTIEVAVDDKVIDTKGTSDEGMVIDFSDLKEIMMKEIDGNFDHGFVVYKDDVYMNFWELMFKDGLKIITVDFIPTAENLATCWFEMLQPKLANRGIKLHHVKVWETPTSTATFTA